MTTQSASIKFGDVFLDSVIDTQSKSDFNRFKNLEYKVAPLSEIYKTEKVGTALMTEGTSSASQKVLKVSSKDFKIACQPSELLEIISPITDTHQSVVSTRGGIKTSIFVKNENINLLDDEFGSYLDFLYNPTDSMLWINSVVGRLVCTNGMTVKISSRIPSWQSIKIEEARSLKPERLVDQIYANNQKYLDTLKKLYETMAVTRVTRNDYENLIIPNALRLVFPEKSLTDLDREILRDEDPEKLIKIEESLRKVAGKREVLRDTLERNYDENDTQNFQNTLYKAFLALSDAETHGALKKVNSGYKALYSGLAVTSAILRASGYPISMRMVR